MNKYDRTSHWFGHSDLKELDTIDFLKRNQWYLILYDRNCWWMVYEKITKWLPPLRRSKLSKKEQDKEEEIEKNYMKLISGGMIGNSNYIGTSLNGLIQEVKSKGFFF